MSVPSPLPFPLAPPLPPLTRDWRDWRRWWPARLARAAIPARGQPQHYERAGEAARAVPEQIEAFEHFFRQFEPRVSSYLWRMLRDEQAAYDLSQETFLRAWQHFAEISAYPLPASWLFRVATNLALEQLRRRATLPGAAQPLNDDIEVAGADPIARLCERDTVVQALSTLPPKQRALLVLREVYGFSTEEAGRTLGLSLAAARRMLSRAHQHFRQSYLRKEGQS